MTANHQRLPGLDGLRACAVTLVIFSHAFDSQGFPQATWLSQPQRTFHGALGVQLFFAISGFLITHLLLREKSRTGTISLKQFWLRRCVRILPPALAFLAVIQFIGLSGAAPVPAETQLGSLFFYRNMMPVDPWFENLSGFTIHYWSLSVEEQFYVIWPLLVAGLAVPALRRIAVAGIAISLALRVCGPWLPAGNWRWLPMNFDCFMAGALVAFHAPAGVESPWVRLWRYRWPLLVLALLVMRLEGSAYKAIFAPVQPLLGAITAGVWIAGLINGLPGLESRVLNCRPLVALGLISYSVYLWQQLCLSRAEHWSSGSAPWLLRFPQNLGLCILFGALGYWLIERPCQHLKEWLVQARPRRVDGREDVTAICPR